MIGPKQHDARWGPGVEFATRTTCADMILEALKIVKRRIARDLFPDTLPALPLPIFPEAGSVKECGLLSLIAGPIRQSAFTRSWRLAYVGFLRNDGWAILSRDVVDDGRPVSECTLDRQDEATRIAADRYRRQPGIHLAAPAWPAGGRGTRCGRSAGHRNGVGATRAEFHKPETHVHDLEQHHRLACKDAATAVRHARAAAERSEKFIRAFSGIERELRESNQGVV